MIIKVMQVLIILKFKNFLILKCNFKYTESAIRNTLIDLLSELRGFKLVKTLALEFKKIEDDEKNNRNSF